MLRSWCLVSGRLEVVMSSLIITNAVDDFLETVVSVVVNQAFSMPTLVRCRSAGANLG